MDNDKQDLPDCFGDLNQVFPMTESGLRETPEACFYHCPVKTPCLKRAMGTDDGTQVEEELIDRGHQAGMVNFFERWSRKKQVHRRRNKK
ncbi:MAG: hypothetical protein D3926_08660 [Desulfobacteraceae bacterium]|nr:MAG: hypothetical protein D3926_08660 [Desulfobacteraceae bacterium]